MIDELAENALAPKHESAILPAGMTGKEFRESSYVRAAARPAAETEVKERFPVWRQRVKNPTLLGHAENLWQALTSGRLSKGDKMLVLGALLYLISPIDLIPDAIPIVGWLDDIGVATFVLTYLGRKLDASAMNEPISGTGFTPKPPPVGHEESGEDNAPSSQDRPSPFSVGSETYSSLANQFAGIGEIAREAGANNIAEEAERLGAGLNADYSKVIFVGRYNTGKSTLLNALLGKQWLLAEAVPTTHAITYLLYGDEPHLFSQTREGEITTHTDAAELLQRRPASLAMAQRICLFAPAEILRGKVCLIDTPGLEEPGFDYSDLILREIPDADALVLVLDAGHPLGGAEQRFVEDLLRADRERKLLVVLNKVDDNYPPLAVDELVRAVREGLAVVGAKPPIYALSAEKALSVVVSTPPSTVPTPFTSFRDELQRFLRDGVGTERRRTFRRRAAALGEELRAACRSVQQLQAADEATRQEARRALEASRQQRADAARDAREKLERHLDDAIRRFHVNLDGFFYELDRGVAQRIDAADLQALRQTNEIERLIKRDTQAFIENQLANLEARADDTFRELHERLHAAQVRLPGGLYQAPRISPEAVVPLALVLAFPFMGIFSFAATVAAATFGRGMIEGLVKNLMNTHGVTQLRAALMNELTPKLASYREQVVRDVDAHLRAWREQVLTRGGQAEHQETLAAVWQSGEEGLNATHRRDLRPLVDRLDRLNLSDAGS